MEQWLEAHIYIPLIMLVLAVVIPVLIADWQVKRKKKKYGDDWIWH